MHSLYLALALAGHVLSETVNINFERMFEGFNAGGCDCESGGSGGGGSGGSGGDSKMEDCPMECESKDPYVEGSNSGKNGIFDPPLPAEMKAVESWLVANGVDGNTITPIVGADGNDNDLHQKNFAQRIEVHWPAKTEAEAYLWGTGAKPARMFKVLLHMGNPANAGSESGQYVTQKVVGPVVNGVTDGSTAITDLPTPAGVSHKLPWKARTWDPLDSWARSTLNTNTLEAIEADVLVPAFGATHPEDIDWMVSAPPQPLEDQSGASASRKFRMRVHYKVYDSWRGRDLNQLPLSYVANLDDPDRANWFVNEIYFCDTGPYADTAALIAAYKGAAAGADIKRCDVENPKVHIEWLQRHSFPERRGPMRERAEWPGTLEYAPGPARFKISGRVVEWMGWSFVVTHTFRSGLQLRNVMYKGERIAYEMSLSEILLTYSSTDHIHANCMFMDSSWGLGEFAPMIPGVDCPETAYYFTNSWWSPWGGVTTTPVAACVFETMHDAPLVRRKDGGGGYGFGIKKRDLVVKIATPVGNYDYTTHVCFSLDGQIHMSGASSGYPQTDWWRQFWSGYRDAFGYKISASAYGPMHDHTFGFKVDIDVAEKNNYLETAEFKWGDVATIHADTPTAPLAGGRPAWMYNNELRYMKFEKIATEDNARFVMSYTTPKTYTFFSSSKTNSWGAPRGFKFGMGGGITANVIPDNAWNMPATDWSRYHLQVTQQKDEEDAISGLLSNWWVKDQPDVIGNYFNGESLDGVDIVLWIALHVVHAPRAEDFPLTPVIGVDFHLEPFNFFDYSDAMDMPNHLEPRDDDTRHASSREPFKVCTPDYPDM